jgi:hypothetical protein
VSELSDHHIDNFETKYRAGERVTAKILKVFVKICRRGKEMEAAAS